MSDKPTALKDILLKGSYVTQEDIQNAEKYAADNNTSIEEYLLKQGLITKDLIGQALAEQYKSTYADLNSVIPSSQQVLKIPEDVAKNFYVALYKETDKDVIIATDNPLQVGLEDELKSLFPKKKIKFAYALPEDIESLFIHYVKPLESRFTKIISEEKKVAPELFDEIVEDALARRASDIHFEPQADEVIIRFRVDGVMLIVGKLEKKYYENILNRVKVLSRLRIDEHFSAQDGSIRYSQGNNVVDMRVSVAPVVDGEKITIRVLSQYVSGFNLDNLGLEKDDQEKIFSASRKPFGMILVTGPTGSGKTTTLYSLLKILNRAEVNVTTIEDPVEYRIAGVNHIQVNPDTNLTFAKGLRSIVRQDPDIILVGEIRDEETAEIAVNAALTGHLLLSTFHANDSSTSVPRLLDMGIEPFLLASTLEIIIAQRLVRKICENCRVSYNVSKTELHKLYPTAKDYFKDKTETLYKGKGCESCGGVGFKGRTGVFEIIEISKPLEELILTNPSSQEVWAVAKKEGAKSMFDDGMSKVKNGVTTIEELMRVAPVI